MAPDEDMDMVLQVGTMLLHINYNNTLARITVRLVKTQIAGNIVTRIKTFVLLDQHFIAIRNVLLKFLNYEPSKWLRNKKSRVTIR